MREKRASDKSKRFINLLKKILFKLISVLL